MLSTGPSQPRLRRESRLDRPTAVGKDRNSLDIQVVQSHEEVFDADQPEDDKDVASDVPVNRSKGKDRSSDTEDEDIVDQARSKDAGPGADVEDKRATTWSTATGASTPDNVEGGLSNDRTAFTPAPSGAQTPATMYSGRGRSTSLIAFSVEDPDQRSAAAGPVIGADGEVYVEGGYGWVVTGCAFTLLFLYLGILYSWGVYQAEFVTTNVGSSLSLSAVGGLQVFTQAIGCLPASYILPRIGQRNTVYLGLATVGISLIISSFLLNNIGALIFLQGLMFGLGGAFIYLTAYTAPSQWFDKKRGLCTGIASCGAGLGGAVYSVVTERLIASWGTAWTYRFFGLVTMVIGFPTAYLLRPGPITHTSPNLVARGLSARAPKPVFRSSRFVRILVAVFIASYPFFIPPYYIPQYAQSVGLSASQGALYSALFNVASAIGRVAFGVLADTAMGNITAWSMSILMIALSSLLVWPRAVDQPLIIVFVFFCGLGSGGFFTLQSSVVAQIIGLHRLQSGVSYLEVAGSFGFLAGPISAGALLDAFGGVDAGAAAYRPAIYLVGGATLLSWFLVVSVRYSSSKSLWKRV